MKKQLIFLLIALISSTALFSQAQNDIRARRVIANEQILLRNTRIDSILNDTTGIAGRTKSLLTAKAIYDFVVGRSGTGGGGMVYPGAGIAVSTGSAWSTSITDNSSNWNTAYSWGNHAGLYPSVSRFSDSLANHWTSIIDRVKYADTASMLANYIRRQELKDTASAIRASIPLAISTLPLSSVTAATAANTIDHGSHLQEWQWNSKNNYGLRLTANTTADVTAKALLSSYIYGVNATSSRTTYAFEADNRHTGTNSTNIAVSAYAQSGTTNYGLYSNANNGTTAIAGYFTASLATNNYAIIVPSTGGRVGIGTTAPSASSIMELSSTTAGFLIPRMNTTQQNAISTPATGLLIYNTDSATLVQYTGTAWRKIGSGGSGTVTSFSFTDGNGFDGTVTNSGTTPALSLTTTVANKALIYSNSGAVAASMATQETDQILITGTGSTTPFKVDGHEDLVNEIVNVSQSGVKKFAFHSNGSIELQDVSVPSTPASGYGRLYVRDDSLRFINDAGIEFTVGRVSAGASSLNSLSDVTLTNETKGQIIYRDTLTGQWINGYDLNRRRLAYEFFDEFDVATYTNSFNQRVANGGGITRATYAAQTTSIKRPGVIRLYLGTNSNGYSSIDMLSNAQYGPFIDQGTHTGETEFTTSFFLDSLSIAASEYVMFVGLHNDARTTEPTYGVYFKYNRAVYGDSLVITTADGGTGLRSNVATTTILQANTWYDVSFVINADNTSLRAYVNGAEIVAGSGTYPITTNFPSNADLASINVAPYAMIRKTSGAGSGLGKALYIDYMGVRQIRPKAQ